MTPGASSFSRGEKRTETQEASSVVKTVDDEVLRLTTKKKEERRRAHASGNWRFGSAEHGERTPQQ